MPISALPRLSVPRAARRHKLQRRVGFGPGLRAFCVSGIVEAPMMTIHLSGKHRASLIRVAADGDDRIHLAIEKFIHVLGRVAGNIDADFLHHFDRLRMDITGGVRSCAVDFQEIAGRRAKDSFGKMAAARVSSAEDENDGLGFHSLKISGRPRFIRSSIPRFRSSRSPCP